ncbi:MAG: hypothetical protein ACYCWW_00185 [Deltaproteobacteria bacterium]
MSPDEKRRQSPPAGQLQELVAEINNWRTAKWLTEVQRGAAAAVMLTRAQRLLSDLVDQLSRKQPEPTISFTETEDERQVMVLEHLLNAYSELEPGRSEYRGGIDPAQIARGRLGAVLRLLGVPGAPAGQEGASSNG